MIDYVFYPNFIRIFNNFNRICHNKYLVFKMGLSKILFFFWRWIIFELKQGFIWLLIYDNSTQCYEKLCSSIPATNRYKFKYCTNTPERFLLSKLKRFLELSHCLGCAWNFNSSDIWRIYCLRTLSSYTGREFF